VRGFRCAGGGLLVWSHVSSRGLAIVVSLALNVCWGLSAFAQSQRTQDVFSEDKPAAKRATEQLTRSALHPKGLGTPAPGLDFQAPKIEFQKEKSLIVGSGGVVISEKGVQVQAERGTFNTETKVGDVSGDVVMTTASGVLIADTGNINIDTETGEFLGLSFDVEEGGYRVNAQRALKLSEFEFELFDSRLTTCQCVDGITPWEIVSGRCHLTQGGYAHSYNSTLYFEGLPVLYSPYMVFPVKTDRASGLLPATFGSSSRDGFQYVQPIFATLGESAGAKITPFVFAKTRLGMDVEYERLFSRYNKVDLGLLYSNESLRDGALRGLNVSGVDDPSIDTNRFGGYYKQRWTTDNYSSIPTQFVVDGHYASDNLLVREISVPKIGQQQAQFLTSTALIRTSPLPSLSFEGRGEFNQMLLAPQETQFQRLPELAISGGSAFRPFGSNPLGLKLLANANVVATDFYREEGYQGWRTDINPKLAVPFHVENYVRGKLSGEFHQTAYNLSDTLIPEANRSRFDGRESLETSSERFVPILRYDMTTALERIYDLDRNSWLVDVTSYGAKNEGMELTRVKHTIEPVVGYSYVPYVDQADIPLFDQLDRFRERSLLSYGVVSRLYGRFYEPYEQVRDIEDLASHESTLPVFDVNQSLFDFGRGVVLAPQRLRDTREGRIRELARFSLRQGYDYVEARKDLDPSRNGFTDINIGALVAPTDYFSAAVDSNYNQEQGQFSSHNITVGFHDDRSDALRLRYSFVDGVVNQIESNVEVALTDRLRAGLYGRYDARQREFLESQSLFRFVNSCNCWSIDVGLSQRINPDRRQFLVSLSFGGVGSLQQGIGLSQ
jgi:LPS-assembly protein